MILVDANIALYAYDTTSPHHEAARVWLEDVLNGDEEVDFALTSLLAFIRISTNPVVFRRPLRASEAIGIVTGWLGRPNVRTALPTERHWAILDEVATGGQARGPLIMDAHLAALALERGATLATSDRDFARFPRLRLIDPIHGAR